MSTVVLLISDKRSGSTMFQRELCRHPDVAHVEYSPHTHYETHHWLKGAVMLEMAQELFSGGRRYPGYGSPKNARTYMIDCIKGNIPEYVVKSEGKELIFDSWEALCERYAKPVFFEKSPQSIANWASLSLLLEWTRKTRHNVKIVGLTRNPMAVMYSAQSLFYTDPEKRQFSWMELQKNLLSMQALLPEATFMHCKYEDLVMSPNEEFAKVCEFVGIPQNDQVGKNIHADSLEKWRSNPGFDFSLDESVIQLSEHFGYTISDVENNATSHEKSHAKARWERILQEFTSTIHLSKSRLVDRHLKPWILRMKK